jgi:hypothetical protein
MNASEATIAFNLPSGTYQYQLLGGLTPSNGTIHVSGSSVTIHVSPVFAPCTVP